MESSSNALQSMSGPGPLAITAPAPLVIPRHVASAGGNASAKSKKQSTPRAGSSTPRGTASTPIVQSVTVSSTNTMELQVSRISRALLGGTAANGFVRSTGVITKIKKQRMKMIEGKEGKRLGNGMQNELVDDGTGVDTREIEILNSHTMKRIKEELNAGIQFCASLQKAINDTTNFMVKNNQKYGFGLGPNSSSTATATKAIGQNGSKQPPQQHSAKTTTSAPVVPATEPPNPYMGSSTLRKLRKSSIPIAFSPLTVNNSLIKEQLKLPSDINYMKQVDEKGTRVISKKESCRRAFEISRWRQLNVGDLAAAKLQSRDMWILCKVMSTWKPPSDMSYVDIIEMPAPRRDNVLAEVLIKDADSEDAPQQRIARNLILPLPRKLLEAAEWGFRAKKSTRVYAVYPETSSLYAATVVDNTTYCRKDEDIIVVEFEGDEDEFGALPQRHVPARFVTLIPAEMGGGDGPQKKKRKGGAGGGSGGTGNGKKQKAEK